MPYVNNAASQPPDQTLDILIEGEGLSVINQGRLLANSNSWLPVRVLESLRPADPPVVRSLRRPGIVDWLQSRMKDNPEPPLQTEVTVPMSVAAQASHNL